MRSYDEENFLNKIWIALKLIFYKNRIICHDFNRKAKRKRINLNYYRIDSRNDIDNLGDYLSKIIYEKMIEYYHLNEDKVCKETKHLYAIGSILFTGFQDCTVWGTGIIREYNETLAERITLKYNTYFRKLDVRCVRGPKTRDVLLKCGVKCPAVYGDPAVLLPLFYEPKELQKKDYIIIAHYTMDTTGMKNVINMKTCDYEYVIDQICSAKFVISSSLHGVILAEAYGIPAVLLDDGVEFTKFKYDDYYQSTGRKNYPIAKTVDEAMRIQPPQIPDFENMRNKLLNSFPKDLWE